MTHPPRRAPTRPDPPRRAPTRPGQGAVARLAAQGATHVCLPSEMPAPTIAVATRAARDLGLGVEVQVVGRAVLAVSARCSHARARARARTKDNRRFGCGDDPDGMPLRARDDRPILRVNGIRTQSGSYLDLLPEAARIVADGVPHLRLMPQAVDRVAVARLFRDVLDARLSAEDANGHLAALSAGTTTSNGFYHGAAGCRRIALAAPA